LIDLDNFCIKTLRTRRERQNLAKCELVKLSCGTALDVHGEEHLG